MKKIIEFFYKIWARLLLVILWPLWLFASLCNKKNKEEDAWLEECQKTQNEINRQIAEEMNLQISHLPDSLQKQFIALNIDPVKAFLALHGTALLALSYQIHCGCKEGFISLNEYGNISFEKYTGIIPAATTIREMFFYAKVDEDTAKKLLVWACGAAVYWPKVIPELKVTKVDTANGKLILTLKEDRDSK